MSKHKTCASSKDGDASSVEALSDVESDLLILFRQLSPDDQGCVHRVAEVLFQGADVAGREPS